MQKGVTIFQKISILDVLQGSENASESNWSFQGKMIFNAAPSKQA